MRVLLLTRPGNLSNPTTVAKVARATVQNLLTIDPEMYVQWVIPRGTSDEALWQYVGDMGPDLMKRIKFLPVQAALGERTVGYFLTEEIWYQLSQTKAQVPYDVVVNQQPAMTMIYSTLLWNRYQGSRYNVSVPIVNLHQWLATEKQAREQPEYYAGKADVVAESISSMFAKNVFESQHLLDEHVATVRPYVQPAVIRKIVDDSVVLHNGVAVDKLRRRTPRPEKPTLFWGGRLTDVKHPDDSFEVMQAVQRLTGCRVIVCTQSADIEWVTEKYPDFEVHGQVDLHGWHKMLEEGSVFVCNSSDESYGVAWLEMLAAGMLGVFKRHEWVDQLMPEWYPYVVESREEQIELTMALMMNAYGELWNLSDRVTAWLDEEHNERKSAEGLLSILYEQKKQALFKERGKINGTMGQLVSAAAESAWEKWGSDEPIPEELIWSQMSTMSKSDRDWGKRGDIVSRMFLRRMAEGNGWRDVCRSDEVEFAPPAQ